MIYVNDRLYDLQYFQNCYERFNAHPVLLESGRQRIAVLLQDPALWIALCLYVKAKGGTVFPLPADTPVEGAIRRAGRSGCQVLIVGHEAGEFEFIDIASPHPASSGVSGGLIQTSSGTTGEPKFIERTWESIDTEIESYIRHLPEAETWTPVVACPVTHSYGLICGVLAALRRGVQPIIVQNLNPKFVLRKLRETPHPFLYSSPAMIALLAMLVKEDEPLWALMTSGTLLPRKTFESIGKKVRHLYQQYGCSETGCLSLGTSLSAANDLGNPLPHVSLRTGEDVGHPAGVIAFLSDDTAVDTRDLGYLENGRLFFVSRLDDVINVAGLNVYPGEVEEVILAMPGIRDAVIFRKPRGLAGDQVCLHFVSDEAITADALRAYCLGKLAAHQVPMSIERVDAIPRLPNGKISRKALSDASEPRVATV